jgi:hypothetical protein
MCSAKPEHIRHSGEGRNPAIRKMHREARIKPDHIIFYPLDSGLMELLVKLLAI